MAFLRERIEFLSSEWLNTRILASDNNKLQNTLQITLHVTENRNGNKVKTYYSRSKKKQINLNGNFPRGKCFKNIYNLLFPSIELFSFLFTFVSIVWSLICPIFHSIPHNKDTKKYSSWVLSMNHWAEKPLEVANN